MLAPRTCLFFFEVLTLYLIIHSGNLPEFVVKLAVYNVKELALLSLMEEAEQSSLDPSLGLMSLPLHIDSKRSGYITTKVL